MKYHTFWKAVAEQREQMKTVMEELQGIWVCAVTGYAAVPASIFSGVSVFKMLHFVDAPVMHPKFTHIFERCQNCLSRSKLSS